MTWTVSGISRTIATGTLLTADFYYQGDDADTEAQRLPKGAGVRRGRVTDHTFVVGGKFYRTRAFRVTARTARTANAMASHTGLTDHHWLQHPWETP